MVTQSPDFFNRGPSPIVRLLFFMALAIAVMVADARFHYLQLVRSSLATVAYPLQQAALAPGQLFARVGDFFVTHYKMQQEIVQLKRELLLKSEAQQKYHLLESELEGLRKLLGAREKLQESALIAEIIHSGRNPFTRRVIVDKGAQGGVKTGLAVIDADGVLGQVTAVSMFTSEVTLLTDKNQAVPIVFSRNGLRAVVFGNGQDGTLDLPYLPINADVQNGDVLVTSGIDGTYPAGLVVAKVTKIERNANYAFSKVTCTPSAGVDRAQNVLILTNRTAEARPAIEPGQLDPKPAASKPAKGGKRRTQ
jgi:rod shape-determining protein MreC